MRFKEEYTTVYFVRHGQTDYPTNRIYCDNTEDPVLSSSGFMQAEAAATWFKNKSIDLILTSPSNRTFATANKIATLQSCAVEKADELVERRFGIWEGLYFEEIEKQFPDDYLQWKIDKVGFTPKNGETIVDVQDRLKQFLSRTLIENKSKNIVVVSHVGPIRISLCESIGIPIENYRHIHIDYASISRVDYGDKTNNVVGMNFVTY